MTPERWLPAAMVAAVSLIAAAMLLDEDREFDTWMQWLAESQLACATAVAADLEARLSDYEEESGHALDVATLGANMGRFLGGALQLELPGGLREIWIAAPGEDTLLHGGSTLVRSPVIRSSIDRGASNLFLTREEAEELGLPKRVAAVGISRVKGKAGPWSVVVVASGQRLRVREQHAQLRFLLGLFATFAIVVGFGGAALRQHWRKREVAQQLELSALQNEREKLLARADKLATLAALSSGIAHEVATPLGTIMARVEQVLPAVADVPRAAAALTVVSEQVERIQAIIQGVLGLVRGELPPFVHAQPTQLARKAMGLVSHRFGEARVSLSLDATGELPEVACNPPMLEQALANLLLNACDASDAAYEVRLVVRASDGRLSFAVEDDGEGIAKENAERVREPFFTTKNRGTGLGLAIAREIVSHHGGRIHLEQRSSSRGTRAVIELPHT
ncbi:MAG TPA: ATP-binding protein [Polyangiales bacterium]|nr:ATP-binding protein [Polyangiales bacterium]